MPYNPAIHQRRSIRLQGYDYSQAGAYFLTICVQGRESLFGAASLPNGIVLNDAGRMVERWWQELPRKFPGVIADAFVVMPNHAHGILIIAPVGADAGGHIDPPLPPASPVGADLCVGPDSRMDVRAGGAHTGAPLPDVRAPVGADLCVGPDRGVGPDSRLDVRAGGAHTGAPLPVMVQWFKTMTTNEYLRGVKRMGWPPCPGRLWQRNYYEHVIRSEVAMDRIRQYIEENPTRWALDHDNPAAIGVTGKMR
jgi:REP element-mobilizing transposase RayT